MLLAHGGNEGGYAFCIQHGHLRWVRMLLARQ